MYIYICIYLHVYEYIYITWEFQYLSTQRHRYLSKTWQFLHWTCWPFWGWGRRWPSWRFCIGFCWEKWWLHYNWLVPTPLKNSQLGLLFPCNIWKKKMFQATKQITKSEMKTSKRSVQRWQIYGSNVVLHPPVPFQLPDFQPARHPSVHVVLLARIHRIIPHAQQCGIGHRLFTDSSAVHRSIDGIRSCRTRPLPTWLRL